MTLIDLAERVEAGESSNELDVLIEVALFEPDEDWVSARSNSAGTKVIYTSRRGHDLTRWAPDWTSDDPLSVAVALRARDTYAKRQDRNGLGPKDSGPVPERDALKQLQDLGQQFDEADAPAPFGKGGIHDPHP